MTLKETLLKRADFVLENASLAKKSGKTNEYGSIEIDYVKMNSFRTCAKSFILSLFKQEHPYFTSFSDVTRDRYSSNLEAGVAIIENVKAEIINDWLSSIKGLVSAEIYSDFLDMAKHLLDRDYKDAAAVMIGGVLEEQLRQLCIKHGIPITQEKDGKVVPLKADRLNSELAKAEVYNKLDQKNVTAQLDLRNNAAHGSYNQYDKNQVEIMYDSVTNFIVRHQL